MFVCLCGGYMCMCEYVCMGGYMDMCEYVYECACVWWVRGYV